MRAARRGIASASIGPVIHPIVISIPNLPRNSWGYSYSEIIWFMELFGYACKKRCIFLLGCLIHTANMVLRVDTGSTGDHGFQTSLFSLLFCFSVLFDDGWVLK